MRKRHSFPVACTFLKALVSGGTFLILSLPLHVYTTVRLMFTPAWPWTIHCPGPQKGSVYAHQQISFCVCSPESKAPSYANWTISGRLISSRACVRGNCAGRTPHVSREPGEMLWPHSKPDLEDSKGYGNVWVSTLPRGVYVGTFSPALSMTTLVSACLMEFMEPFSISLVWGPVSRRHFFPPRQSCR